MPVIDVQVHPFDRNHPGRPWASPSHGLDSATGEEMVAAMNSVGVDGVIRRNRDLGADPSLGQIVASRGKTGRSEASSAGALAGTRVRRSVASWISPESAARCRWERNGTGTGNRPFRGVTG